MNRIDVAILFGFSALSAVLMLICFALPFVFIFAGVYDGGLEGFWVFIGLILFGPLNLAFGLLALRGCDPAMKRPIKLAMKIPWSVYGVFFSLGLLGGVVLKLLGR